MTAQTIPFPPGMATAGGIVHRLLALGVPLRPLSLLETHGWRTDRPHTIPVAILAAHDEHWLVSPFGPVGWVVNVRDNGHAALGRGRRLRSVRLTEVTDGRKPDLVDRYRQAFSVVPFVRAAFAPRSGDPASIDPPALDRPVFHVEPQPGGLG